MIRIFALLSLLALAPLASAEQVCTPDQNACVIANPDDRFAYYGAYAYEPTTGTFVGGGYGEGSGFFADTATVDVVSYGATSGQWVVVVVAANDYGRDGDYDDAGYYVGTWNDDPTLPGAGYGDSVTLP